VLLRYLSDVYKTLSQSVPDSYKTEELEDRLAELRLSLRQVDSSLIDEWERMQSPIGTVLPEEKIAAAQPKPIWEDAKAFAARIRGEMHQLLKALAERRYDDALTLLKSGEIEWSPELLEKEMNPYWAVYPSVKLTPDARRPQHTLLKRVSPQRWEARQRIIDPEDHGDWMLDCLVDVSTQASPNDPFVELRRIGVYTWSDLFKGSNGSVHGELPSLPIDS
jgi:hypothetical protein